MCVIILYMDNGYERLLYILYYILTIIIIIYIMDYMEVLLYNMYIRTCYIKPT